MPRISQENHSQIFTLREEGYSVREIAASEQVGLASVLRICKKKKETGTFDDLEKTGRPRLLTDRYERYAIRLLMTEQCSTALEVKIKLKSDLGIDISVESVRRIFWRNGLSSKTKRKKPILKKTHRKRRLAWAKKYRDFTVDDWRLVLWSDESKFQLFGSDGRKYCWLKANEQLNQRQIIPTMKFGGGAIMVWGCMNAEGVGQLKKIDVKMNADIYVDILNENLLDSLSAKGLSEEEIFYQQDNDPKHTSKKV